MAKGKKTGGRAKGTPNRLGAPVKQAILNTFNQLGGEKWLLKLAKGTAVDRQMFCRMVEKLVPGELKLDPESQLNLVILRDYTGEHDAST